jgi:hypothetical protein
MFFMNIHEMYISLTKILFCLYGDFTVISQATIILIFLRNWFFLTVRFSALSYPVGLHATLSLLIRQEIGLGLFFLTL